MRHQSPVRSRARSEYFYARAVRVQLHTRVFLKFKSSYTVVDCCFFIQAIAITTCYLHAYSWEMRWIRIFCMLTNFHPVQQMGILYL